MAKEDSLVYNPTGGRGNVFDEEAARAYNIEFGRLIEPATHKVFYVNLGNKPMTLEALKIILKYLESTIAPCIKIVDVSDLSVQGGHNETMLAFGLISKALSSSEVLQVLNLSNNNLGNNGIRNLEKLLTKKTLERINVSNCKLKVQDAKKLFLEWLRPTKITHLSIGSNPAIVEDNGQVIASFVGKCTRLAVIELSSLAPGRAGTRALVKSVHKLVENQAPLEWVSLNGFDFCDIDNYEELKATLGHDNLQSLEHVNVMNSGIERLPSEEQNEFKDLLYFNSGLVEDKILIGNDIGGDSDEQESQFVELSMII